MNKAIHDEKSFPLNTLYFYLTEGCNLACRHCWIAPKYQRDGQIYPSLPLDLFRSIISQAKPMGLNTIKLTGGEPLLHPAIADILELTRIEKLMLNVETNGVLCSPILARKIAECENPFVSVSIDGTDAETHEWLRGVPGCYEAALRGIRNLVDAGLKPELIMTLNRRNKNQIDDFLELAESLGCSAIKFNMLQNVGRGEIMHRDGEALTIEELVTINEYLENSLSKSTKLNVFASHPVAFRPLSRMFGSLGNGCHRCNILRILGVLADGSYALCGIGATIPELIFGNAARDKLEDIWKKSIVLKEIREGVYEHYLKGICSSCVVKTICIGHCIANNYHNSKDLWAPYWYCEEAYKAGLFPESRQIVYGNSDYNRIKVSSG
jgi:SynChlorMet cassette radical SAM/SPASM protein ScmF